MLNSMDITLQSGLMKSRIFFSSKRKMMILNFKEQFNQVGDVFQHNILVTEKTFEGEILEERASSEECGESHCLHI